jgi:hypothetical protein
MRVCKSPSLDGFGEAANSANLREYKGIEEAVNYFFL